MTLSCRKEIIYPKVIEGIKSSMQWENKSSLSMQSYNVTPSIRTVWISNCKTHCKTAMSFSTSDKCAYRAENKPTSQSVIRSYVQVI